MRTRRCVGERWGATTPPWASATGLLCHARPHETQSTSFSSLSLTKNSPGFPKGFLFFAICAILLVFYERISMANSIQVGSKVQLEIDGKVNEFLIIASGDPTTYREGTITADSQIGQALMGRAVGEAAEIIIEGTPRTYKIVAIE